MRYTLLLCLASCYAGIYRDWSGGSQHQSHAQAPEPDEDEDCARPERDAQLCEACKDDDDCKGEGSLCLPNGRCGQKCVVDCDCPDTYECRGASGQTSRQCVPADGQCAECNEDSDCKDGKICAAEKCVPRCIDDASCGTDLRCFEDGRCGRACCFDTDCAAAERCATGRCEKT